MLTTTERGTAPSPASTPSPASPPGPRLRLQPDLSARTLLDGGWWPRSADPAAELPGLILAIDDRHGPVTQIMLGSAGWHASRPGRLRVDGPAGSRTVRLGWYETMPAGLLTATARAGRTDLLTVPPQTSEAAAWAAMDQAAQPGNRTHAPALLAAITPAVSHACPAGRIPAKRAADNPGDIEVSTWEWEGGQDSASRQASAGSPGPGTPSSARAGGAERSTRASADSPQ
jgi:Family of unknown function (DUF5994)